MQVSRIDDSPGIGAGGANGLGDDPVRVYYVLQALISASVQSAKLG